jgi:type VI secretion system protein ImpH
MASASRRTTPSLERELFDRSYEFEFFQAVRLLGHLMPQREAVGGRARPKTEIVRFGATVSLAFPPSELYEIVKAPETSDPVRMIVTFMGLAGLQGVLPICYTEWMLSRRAAKDDTLTAFFDLFNHRFISLFYRAWEKHRPAVLYDSADIKRRRPNSDREPDPFTHSLFDFIGMGTNGLRDRLSICDEGLLYYAGLLAQRPHSAASLRGLLRDFFTVPIEIEQCLGSWYELADDDRCYLSGEHERNQLGVGAFIGAEVWNQQARFRIRVGPLSFDRFRDFLPGGRDLAKMVDLTRFFVGLAIAFDVQVALRAAEVPFCRLADEGLEAPRLGWMGWLKTEEFRIDAKDTLFAYAS